MTLESDLRNRRALRSALPLVFHRETRWERGSGGVESTGVSQRVKVTGRDESQSVPSPQNSLKQEIWSSHFLRDPSQVVRRTPRDTPVPLYTRTSPWPIVQPNFAELSGELSGAICLKTLVLLGSALELFRQFFGAVRAIFEFCVATLPAC